MVVGHLVCGLAGAAAAASEFRAGAAAVDISPRVLPAIANGGFIEATRDRVDDPLSARCLALANGDVVIGIAIVDSCMVPRDVCDEIKSRVDRQIGLPASRILIAATHTHSAPSLMDFCLGSRKDPAYADTFIPRVVEGIIKAHSRLAPAEVGWAVVDAPKHTNCRRWLHRPEAFDVDPFGDKTVRAMMHPGYQNPAYVGPAGPVDTKLTLLSIRSTTERPLAVLANYSMHYFGGPSGFSADYFGAFARYLEEKVAPRDDAGPAFVGIMSQGTSGDQHWMDYSQPMRAGYTLEQYAHELGDIALATLGSVDYRRDVPLAMAETKLTLSRRLPSAARLEWAKGIRAKQTTPRPSNLPEVYAEQAEWIHEHPTAELVLQSIRVGELGMTAIPNEVFGITGLKLKAQSPLEPLMNLELANGAEGYIPPPEQHCLGGYTTWPARSAGLETEAEAKIVAAVLELLEQVSDGKKRRPPSGDFYNAQQRLAIEQAQQDDNNRENRGQK